MKELVFLRHAKSNREYLVEDVDRPLSLSGIRRIKKISKKKQFFFNSADIFCQVLQIVPYTQLN
tara:strand:- start:188 stop:379 length:192 start_codon:yes stop_codon:yes gene_type:complete